MKIDKFVNLGTNKLMDIKIKDNAMTHNHLINFTNGNYETSSFSRKHKKFFQSKTLKLINQNSQKKAQVAPTITWVVAVFIILLFILVPFAIFAGILAGERKLPLVGKGENEISVLEVKNNFEAQKNLFYLLNLQTNEGETIKELIILSETSKNKQVEEKIKENIEKVFEEAKSKGECHLFSVGDELIYNNLFRGIIVKGKIPEAYKTNFGLSEIILSSAQQQINIRLYSGKC